MAPLIPTLAAHARSFISGTLASNDITRRGLNDGSSNVVDRLGPLAARSVLLARDDAPNTTPNPEKGVVHPNDINNTAVFALFGLIGVAFVCTGIWFFFWAKNGGFYFKQDDWDDYKTTVLRRRGPNGTILSGATPSTQLGGGSIYKDIDDGTSTEYTGAGMTDETGTTLSGVTAGASDILGREKRRRKREKRDREREKRNDRKNRSARKVGEDGVMIDEEAEAEAKERLRAYRHERPARVGGINKESEGSTWDGSTNPDSATNSDLGLLSNRQSTPTSTPTKEKEKRSGGGIRKVYSSADRTADREHERIRTEARRLQEKGRAASRRDFSYQRADDRRIDRIDERSTLAGDTPRVPGSWTESDVGSDVGTKSYHHVIPGLSSSSGAGVSEYGDSNADYMEKRKKRNAGYRRER